MLEGHGTPGDLPSPYPSGDLRTPSRRPNHPGLYIQYILKCIEFELLSTASTSLLGAKRPSMCPIKIKIKIKIKIETETETETETEIATPPYGREQGHAR